MIKLSNTASIKLFAMFPAQQDALAHKTHHDFFVRNFIKKKK
jgi:hypothetical protein